MNDSNFIDSALSELSGLEDFAEGMPDYASLAADSLQSVNHDLIFSETDSLTAGDGAQLAELHVLGGSTLAQSLVADWIHPDVAADQIWSESVVTSTTTSDEVLSQIGEAFEWHSQKFSDFAVPDFLNFPEVHGTPLEDLALWEEQDAPFSCAVATSSMLFSSIGVDASEPQLAEIFEQFGIYDPAQGTDVSMISHVLNRICLDSGLDHFASDIDDFNLDDLTTLLDNHIRPLIAVNASKLEDPIVTLMNDIGLVPDSPHAVQLTGLLENGMAMLNDPGRTDGGGFEIPISMLLDACSDFGNKAVVLL